MQGLLTDVNVQGYLPAIRRYIEAAYPNALTIYNIRLVTFPDIGIPETLDDRALWRKCQSDGWVLLTENRNHEDDSSLQATLEELWKAGDLPVLTLANKDRFRLKRDYFNLVVEDVLELLIDIQELKCRDQSRIYVPREL